MVIQLTAIFFFSLLHIFSQAGNNEHCNSDKVICLICNDCVKCRASRQIALRNIVELFNKRFEYIEDLALYKADNRLSIENNKREFYILNEAMRIAVKENLDIRSINHLFEIQMNLSKAIEYRYCADYIINGNKVGQSYVSNISLSLLQSTREIVEHIANFLTLYGSFQMLDRSFFLKIITSPYLCDQEKLKLYEALSAVKLVKNTPSHNQT